MPENLSTICETLRSVSLQLKRLNKGEDEDYPLFQDISRALKQIESSADELHKRLKDNQDKLKKLPENIFQTLASLCGLDPDKGEEEQGPGSTSEERISDTVPGWFPKQESERRMAYHGDGRCACNTNDRQKREEMNRDGEPGAEMQRQTNAGRSQQNRNEGKNGQGAAGTDGKITSSKNQTPAAKDNHQGNSSHNRPNFGTSSENPGGNPLCPAQNAGRGELEEGKHLAEDQAKWLEEKEEDIKKHLEKIAVMEKLANDRAKELEEKDEEIQKQKQQVGDLKTVKIELQQTKERLEEELEAKQAMINTFERQVNEDSTEKLHLERKIKKLCQDLHNEKEQRKKEKSDLENICYDLNNKCEGWKMSFQQAKKEHEQEVRKQQQEIESLTKSRDDLRDRFSKVAGQKLNENNPDIADLSDPDRAMKLAERYSAIYDDEWTDAFQEQQEKMKRKTEDIVKYLLEVLKASYQFCEKTAAIQMEALHNVFLHPCQDASLERNAMGAQGGLLDKPRIKSAEDKTLKDLRRKIASNMVSEVKEQFLVKFKKETADKKAMDLSLPYIGKCVEICWLMVLHDPQLHMGVDIKPDTRMDTNVYASYQNSGSVIEYLVWPPLFNGKNGGLLAKGTAQPRKEQGKGKGK